MEFAVPLRTAAFRPRLWSTALMLALVALFVTLGQWQWAKAERKAAAQALLDAGADASPIMLPATLIADAEIFQYRRVAARGHYRAAGQILLDNQIVDTQGEQVGYRVLTPFVIDGAAEGSKVEVLVERGWVVAPADRRSIPVEAMTAVPSAPTFITGTAVVPSHKRFMLAADMAPPGGNARWQSIDLARYARAAQTELQPLVVRLDADRTDGFLRVWPRPDERHERHRSYAFQWFGFAASTVGIWAWSAFRRQP